MGLLCPKRLPLTFHDCNLHQIMARCTESRWIRAVSCHRCPALLLQSTAAASAQPMVFLPPAARMVRVRVVFSCRGIACTHLSAHPLSEHHRVLHLRPDCLDYSPLNSLPFSGSPQVLWSALICAHRHLLCRASTVPRETTEPPPLR